MKDYFKSRAKLLRKIELLEEYCKCSDSLSEVNNAIINSQSQIIRELHDSNSNLRSEIMHFNCEVAWLKSRLHFYGIHVDHSNIPEL